jgi:hypothetical protein
MYFYIGISRISEKKGKPYFLAASAIVFVWVTNGVILPRDISWFSQYMSPVLQYMVPKKLCMESDILKWIRIINISIKFSIYESNLSIYETKVEICQLVITLYNTNSSIYCTKEAIHGTRCPDMKPNYQYINSFLQYMKPVYYWCNRSSNI